MTKIHWLVGIIMLMCFMAPNFVRASSEKTVSGTVISINGSQLILSTVSAAKYSAEVGNAQLMRKNGAAMKFSEILIGDKVEVKGMLWDDNSISAIALKNNSLYSHTATFTGKIISINPPDTSFIISSKTYGEQTINTNNFTAFTKNGASSGFTGLGLGMTASVKGVWDRSRANITAINVEGSFRMIAITFTGILSIKNDSYLTVIGNGNAIYGVDITKATILNKSGKAVSLNRYFLGDTLKVWGKHIPGMVAVVAGEVRDTNLVK